MATKIQINSLEALERLIGNDSKLELEIRNSIVQNFSKKHLKSIAQRYAENGIDKSILTEIRKEFFKDTSYRNFTLSDKYKDVLKSSVNHFVNQEVYKIIDEKINNLLPNDKLEELIGNYINRKIEWHFEKMIKEKAGLKIASLFKEL